MAKKGDKILLVILLVSILGIFGYIQFSRLNVEKVFAVIELDGNEYQRLELKQGGQERTLEISQDNNKINIIELKGDKIRMVEANCPDKVCLHMGFVNKVGQTIVCLPNRVVVRIMGNKGGLDGISY